MEGGCREPRTCLRGAQHSANRRDQLKPSNWKGEFGWGTWIRSKTKCRPKVAGNLDFTGGQHRQWTMLVANRQEGAPELGSGLLGSRLAGLTPSIEIEKREVDCL